MRHTLLCLLLLCLAAQLPQRPSPKLKIYSKWREAVETLRVEWDEPDGLWWRLYESYKTDPPEHVRSLDRQKWLRSLKENTLKRVKVIEELEKLESE